MKLLRWAMAGASAYVIYKYAIGKRGKGENVFDSPDTGEDETPPPSAPPPPPAEAAKRKRPRARKPKAVSPE
jgi:hypothetical protein